MAKYKVYQNERVRGCGPVDSKILIVGEAPGGDEQIVGEPFVGAAGTVLNNCLSRRGCSRDEVRMENLSQYRPWGNQFEFLLNTPFLKDGIKAIHEHILAYRPVVIAACGNYPMHYLTGKGKKSQGKIIGIGNWRGSILPYVDNQGIAHEDIKVVPIFHPAFVARNKGLYPVFDMDIKKVLDESKFRGLNYTEREIIINPRGHKLIQEVKRILQSTYCAIDIETQRGSTKIYSISFSISHKHALVLELTDLQNISHIATILRSNIRKIFHFGYFDTTQLKLNGFEIGVDEDSVELQKPYFWDTYIASHVLEPELPHTLAYETSVRTREPYYKHEGKEESDQKGWSQRADKNVLYRYNGKDTCCTYEVFESQVIDMMESNRNIVSTFNFEMSAIELQTHISNAGMLVEEERLNLLEGAMIARWARLQYLLDGVAGFEVNVKSTPLLKNWLYKKEKDGGLSLPTRYYQRKVTTNDDALVSLLAWSKQKEEDSVREDTKRKYRLRSNIIRAIREIRNIRQRLSMYISAGISSDGRSRSSYKYGPETGRWAAQKYVDGTGYNHQTNPRDPIEVPDEDYEKYKAESSKLLQKVIDEDKEIEE